MFCNNNSFESLKLDCIGNCTNGSCGGIECSSDDMCGFDGWINGRSCNVEDVWQNYRTYDCLNPGTINSSCTYADDYQIQEDFYNLDYITHRIFRLWGV